MKKPHDATDLLLSPVALAIDERLEEFASMDATEISKRIVWETNMQPRTAAEAGRALVASLTYLLDTHGWEVSWDARGIRLHHENHDVVLGVPDNLLDYVATVGHAQARCSATVVSGRKPRSATAAEYRSAPASLLSKAMPSGIMSRSATTTVRSSSPNVSI